VSVDNGGRALVPVPREAGGAGLTPAEAVRRATALALGAAGLALDIARAIVERSGPAGPKGVAARASAAPGPLRRLPGAALGLGLEAQRRSLLATAALGGRLSPRVRAVARPAAAVARAPLAAAWRRLDLDSWAARGLAEQRRNRQDAADVARALVGSVAAAVLDEVDVDGVVGRVDLDRIVGRLDLDRIAERIDVDAIAARLDLDAVVARLDLAGLTEQVIDEVDVGELIRESTGTMTTETVDALRVHGMRADRVLGRVVDHLLRRHEARATEPVGLLDRHERSTGP
jgi:hypothetical protein